MNYYIVNNASRAAAYGIGTYVKQLITVLQALSEYPIYLIELYAEDKDFTVFTDELGITHYRVPALPSQMESETYCRTVGYLLAPYIVDGEPAIFHFNYFQHYPLALWFKARNIHHRILFSVHYFNWCFALNGNLTQFRRILLQEDSDIEDKYISIKQEYRECLKFLHLADQVIVLSVFCQQLLQTDYHIQANKIVLIYNGLKEEITEDNDLSATSPQSVNSYDSTLTGIPVSPFIFYAGRLDEIKGVKYLIRAFHQVLTTHLDARLVLAGNGDFNTCLEECEGIWDKVTFTGHINAQSLTAFYRHATLGVLPSFHEQCSYTAIEYMMHGLPFVGTDSTGLSEMLNDVPQLRVHIDEEAFDEAAFVNELSTNICQLLDDAALRQCVSQQMRANYLSHFTLRQMEQAIHQVIVSLLPHSPLLSGEMLQEVDIYMMRLIHQQPDIDMDFYGMAGIGVYLWWRYQTLKGTDEEIMRAKIGEYLIYYLDWLYEEVVSEGLTSCVQELAFTLREMVNEHFYPLRCIPLTALLHGSSNQGICSPSPVVIWQNAMRMMNTKI